MSQYKTLEDGEVIKDGDEFLFDGEWRLVTKNSVGFTVKDLAIGSFRRKISVDRAEILERAKEHITKNRNLQHGEPEQCFSEIAEMWSVHLEKKISAADVCIMMVLFKMVRAKANPLNHDNWEDACGYAGCGAEVATK